MAKVIYNCKAHATNVGDLTYGDFFIYKDFLYMVTGFADGYDTEDDPATAVTVISIDDNDKNAAVTDVFDFETEVYPVQVKINVERYI